MIHFAERASSAIRHLRLWLVLLSLTASSSLAVDRQTHVSVVGDAFHINGQPTYAGRNWNGKKIEGLLLNSRMVQATFDDLNPQTRDCWAYPDTKLWNADRNLREFLAAMPEWRTHGLLFLLRAGSTTQGRNGGSRSDGCHDKLAAGSGIHERAGRDQQRVQCEGV